MPATLTMEERTLGFWDYAVLISTLLISLLIGIYFRFSGGKQQTTKEYLLGDQKQSALPVALSLMASFMSAVTLLGVAAEVYMFGTLFLTIIVSYVFFTWVAAYLYLPVFFKLQATSAYEYLEVRFGPRVRLAASLVYSLQMLLYMGVVLYAPAVALEALTRTPQTLSILLVGLVCTLYSTLGGIKAVIWTDVFQSLLMYAALFSVVAVAVWTHGGVGPIWDIAKQRGRLQFFDFSLDPTVRHSTFSLFVGGGFTFLSLYAVNQTQVQRYLTVRDHRTAVRSLWLSLPLLYLLLLACGAAGLAIFSVYRDCDPVSSGRIKTLDQLMPLFVMDTMGHVPGLSGLFAAGVFSASLSTVSACVNSLAAVTIEDYLKPLLGGVGGGEGAALGKCVALCYGVACVGVAFVARRLGGLLQAGLSILGVAGGPLLGTFTLGMFFPSANEPGAVVGIASGLCAALWVGFFQPRVKPAPLPMSTAGCPLSMIPAANGTLTTPPSHQPEHAISYLLYVVISCGVTVAAGWMTSQLATRLGHRPAHAPAPHLFSPPVARYLERKRPTRTDDTVMQHRMLNGTQQIKTIEED